MRIRAHISEILLLLAAVACSTISVAADDGPLINPYAEFTPYAAATRYLCGNQPVWIIPRGDSLTVRATGRAETLRPSPDHPGNTFHAETNSEQGPPTPTVRLGGPNQFVWLEGGGDPVACVAFASAPAPNLTASGTEPDWQLSLTADGAAALHTPGASPELGSWASLAPAAAPGTPRQITFDSGTSAELSLRISPCTHAMTGMPYPMQAKLVLDDDSKTLTGCAGDPAWLLTGGEWLLEDLSGTGIIDSSHLSIRFEPDGQAHGHAGCNRWSGSWTLTGEGLTFGPLMSTRKACAASLMDQELRFLAALSEVRRFSIGPNGALLLQPVAGEGLLLRLK